MFHACAWHCFPWLWFAGEFDTVQVGRNPLLGLAVATPTARNPKHRSILITMLRLGLLTLAGFLCGISPAFAAADGLFDSTAHDFGTVPRGPMMTHYYRLTNNTKQTIHVSGVRVSCGCTSAAILQDTIKPGESTAVHAQMDTRRFTGAKTVTIFVSMDQPQWEEARLTISAFGRDDVNFDAEGMSFGSVSPGTTGVARTTVTLRQQHWLVQKASSDSGYVIPKVKEIKKSDGEVTYEVAANLQPGLPVGRWTTEIVLTTNSPVAPLIRIPATVEIAPVLTASPVELNMQKVTVGKPSESTFTIRGAKPFRIKEIQGADGILTSAPTGSEARPTHTVTVKVSPTQAGDMSRKIKVVTDLPHEGTVEIPFKATVNGE